MKYTDLVKVAINIRELLEIFEKKTTGKVWGKKELLMGLVTDVGDLAKLILAKEGDRNFDGDINKSLRHELADCLWAIIILADKYNIDLSKALVEMADDIEYKIGKYGDEQK